MTIFGRIIALTGLAVAASAGVATSAYAAQAPVALGSADSFAVLAGSGITNTGATTITGDVGSFPTPSETGFGSVTLHGANHHGDSVTKGAKNDLVTAYNDAAGRKPEHSVAVELGGTTLLPGVYTSPTLGLTGTLTLNAKGNTNAQFILKAGSTLITATDSRVRLINGAQACNVVWQVGSSATFGTRTQFIGNVLAHTSITATTKATFQGRLLAQVGAVTLDANTITRATCAAVKPTPSPTPTRTRSRKPSASASPSGSPSGSPSVSPTPSGPPGSSTPPASTPVPVPTAKIPFTGLPTAGLVGTGLGLLALGGFFMAITRRGQRGSHS